MSEKALAYFRLFADWGSESVRQSDNPLELPHVRATDADVTNEDCPMVLLAGSSMLTGGPSLEALKKWAPEPRNMVVIPGYCLPGTPGHDVQAGLKELRVGKELVHVRCSTEHVAHSNHTDARGILQLIGQVAPKHALLVHGADDRILSMRPVVEKRLRIPCSDPGVGQTVDLQVEELRELRVSPAVLGTAVALPGPPLPVGFLEPPCGGEGDEERAASFTGLLRKRPREACWELHELSAAGALAAGLSVHRLRFCHRDPNTDAGAVRAAWEALQPALRSAGVKFQWAPGVFEPPAADGQSWRLLFLGCSCKLTAAAGKLALALEWTSEDTRHPSVSQFLAALGGGS